MKNPFQSAPKEMFTKAANETTPHFGAQPNFAMHQLEHEGSNPVHTAHVQKAFALHPDKTHFNQPSAAGQAPGSGSPWLQIANKK